MMEKIIRNTWPIVVLILFSGFGNTYAQNEFYNNGSGITVQAGALVMVQGEVVNTNAGANIGLINNSGQITFSGNWTNNSTSGALTANAGTVDMTGANQTIMGSQPTRFNNLNLLGSGVKTLNVNTFVAGTTGVLALGSRPLDLNSNTLFVTNPVTAAITRSTGYIISETAAFPGYGIIQWNIGNAAAGNYVFPFGSLAANYIPLTLNITSPGAQSTTGAISASTYPTNTNPALNNRPLPTGVNNLNNNCGTEHAPKMLDRFWVINTSNYNTNPVANKQFTYIDNEWDPTGGSTNLITESDLQAWYYNAGWTHLASTNASATNNQTISGNSNYGVFTLGDYKQLNLQLVDVDSVICFGESNGVITFSSNVGYGTPTYSINGTTTTNTVINTLAAGSYTVIGSDIMGCRDTISNINVRQPLKLIAGITSDDYSICRNDTINLTSAFSGGIKPYDISWSTGTTNAAVSTNSLTQMATPQAGTRYWFDLKDKNNCVVHSDTIDVNVNQLPVVDFTADNLEGCEPLAVKFTNLSASTPTITRLLWSFGTGITSSMPSPNYTYIFAGTFNVSLKATTDSGCIATLTKQNHILVHPKPKANFNYTPASGIDILNPEVTFQNTSSGYDNAFWNFNDGTTVIAETNPTHTYADTGVYQVKLVVSTIHNCVDSISIPLKVNEISTLYVPNAFTPDGNSMNDVFAPSGLQIYDYRMMIFDRWGEKIFESSVPNEGWDGKYRGTLCKEGVYVYKIEFKPLNGPVKRRVQEMVGHVSLLHLAK
jgi:gliding motility-associated-like protein